MATTPPSADVVAKAARLVDQGRVLRRCGVHGRPIEYSVEAGDSGKYYHLKWDKKRMRWECTCPAMSNQCSHILAVEEYQRREKEQQMPEQTTTQPVEQQQPEPQRQMVVAQNHAMTPQAYRGEPEGEQLDSIIKISQKLSKSGLFRTRRKQGDNWIDEYASESDVFMIALSGIDFGLSAAASARHLKMIQGALSVSAELMRARLHQFGYEYDLEISPKMVQFPVKSSTGYGNNRREIEKQQTGPESITVHLWRRSNPETRWSATYTIAEAVQAGLTKGEGGWDKNPEDMLVARGTTRVVRRYAPEILNKAYLPEELGYYEEADGQEGTRLVARVVEEPAAVAPEQSAAPHDADTGEVLDGEWTSEDVPTSEQVPDVSDYDAPADGREDPAPAEPATSWAWPPVWLDALSREMLALGYTQDQVTDAADAVTSAADAQALIARVKGEKAAKQEQAPPRAPEQRDPFGVDDDDEGSVGSRLDEDPAEEEREEGDGPDAPEPTLEQATAWVETLATATAAVEGDTVPEDLVAVIGRKDSWAKHMMTTLGVQFAEQDQLCRRFELPSAATLSRPQRLGLLWYVERYGKA